MEHRELTFTKIECVHLPGKSVAAAHVYFADAGGQKYALLMGIGGSLWTFWRLGERSSPLVKKIVFQAAEEYIDEMIWKDKLQEMILKTPFHEKVYGMDDKDSEQCPYAPDQPLPQFPFTRVFWRLREDMPRRKQERYEFLLRLYELGEKHPSKTSFKSHWVGRQVGLKPDTSASIARFFRDDGLVIYKRQGMIIGDEGFPVSITHDGIKEAEEYEKKLAEFRRRAKETMMSTNLNQKQHNLVADAVPFAGNRQVFLAHQFSDKDMIAGLKRLLEEKGFQCVEGKRTDLGSISQDILDKIRRSGFFLAVMTRKDELKNKKGKYTTSTWLIEEKGAAIACDRKPLLMVEDTVDREYVGGLQGDDQIIYFKRDAFADKMQDAVKFMENTLKPRVS